jgi:DNA-directed RNA polymerase II subunit RPB1
MTLAVSLALSLSLGKLIQFAYGEDHVDTTRIESQAVPLVGMSLEEVYMHYDLLQDGLTNVVYTEEAAKRFRAHRQELKTRAAQYVERMIQYRNRLVAKVFRFKDESSVKSPVAFQYIIGNLQGQLRLNADTLLDLTSLEAFDAIEAHFARLRQETAHAQPTQLFEILYYFFVTPRELLLVKRC